MRPFIKNKKKEVLLKLCSRKRSLSAPPPHLIMQRRILIPPDNYFFYDNGRADSLWPASTANNKPLRALCRPPRDASQWGEERKKANEPDRTAQHRALNTAASSNYIYDIFFY